MRDARSVSASPAAAVLRRNLPFVLSAGLSLSAILAMTAMVGYPGFQDFGEWLYQARLLGDLIAGGESPHARIALYPVPLALPQLLLAGCVAVVGVIAGGVVYLGIYGLVGAWAVQAMIRRYHLAEVPAALLLTGSVLLGSGFWNGFIGSQWGLVVLIGYLSLGCRSLTSLPALTAFGLISFFTHGLTFAAWGLTALCLAAWQRRLGQFAVALAPSIALACWYVASSREASRGTWDAGGPAEWGFYKGYTVAKLGSFRHLVFRSATDYDVAPAVYWLAVGSNVAFGVALAAAVVWLLLRRASAVWVAHAPLVAAMAGLLAVVVLTPAFLVGIVNPGERVLSSAMVIAVVLLTAPEARGRVAQPAAVLAVVGMVMTCLSLGLIPQKAALAGPISEAPVAGTARSTTLFTHRVDQFEEKVRAAEAGDLTLPLEWHTSLLVAR